MKTLFPKPRVSEKKGIEFLEKSFSESSLSAREKITKKKITELKGLVKKLIQEIIKHSPTIWEERFFVRIKEKIQQIEKIAMKSLRKIETTEDITQIHQFRIIGKRVKYLQEFLGFLDMPQSKSKVLKSIKTHKILGAFNDRLTMKTHLEKFILSYTLDDQNFDKEVLKSLQTLDKHLKKTIKSEENKVEKLLLSWKK